MDLFIPNKAGIETFELDYTPLTLEIYYTQFGHDLLSDCIKDISQDGGLSRTLAQRMIWAMCTTKDKDFMSFIEFIHTLEYNIHVYLETWGKEFSNWFTPLLDPDFKK